METGIGMRKIFSSVGEDLMLDLHRATISLPPEFLVCLVTLLHYRRSDVS